MKPDSAASDEADMRWDKLPHPAELNDDQLLKQCDVKRTRGSGPGGQHRNKVETAIVIQHRPTGVIGQASEARSQAANRKTAMTRLRTNLALAHRCQRSQPSVRWIARTQKNRIAINPQHADFAPLLAEALDYIAANDFEVNLAAKQLQVSTSQLIKFLKLEPQSLAWVNLRRQQLGLGRLK